MKRIITVVAALFMAASLWAQSPEKMSYQAVVRDASNTLVTSQAVGMQISILQGGATGPAVYVETQTPAANSNGLVSLEIGTGSIVSGGFINIDWANGPYYIKTETDPTGGTSYTITGTSQLLSVPYALHAKTATNGITAEQAAAIAANTANGGITSEQATILENTSGTNTGDQTVITAEQAAAIAANTAKGGITSEQAIIISNTSGTNTGDQDISGIATNATAIALNTAKTGITTAQASEITANTAKVGVTTGQATILGNTSGTNTGDQDISGIATNATAIALNTAKTGITTAQANEITANTAKVGVTTGQATILGNTSGTNTGDQDGSETKVSAGTNVSVTGSGTTASPYVVNATSSAGTRYLGEEFDGGIIYYLYIGSDGTQHGLIVSKTESTAIWQATGTTTGADRTEDGAYNTGLMTSSAAATYVTGLGAGWYLPSIDELSLLWNNRFTTNKALRAGGFTLLSSTATYWSSTENGTGLAFYFYFYNGGAGSTNKINPFSVRAVRAF